MLNVAKMLQEIQAEQVRLAQVGQMLQSLGGVAAGIQVTQDQPGHVAITHTAPIAAPNGAGTGKRTMSNAARRAIADAQRKRWDKYRADQALAQAQANGQVPVYTAPAPVQHVPAPAKRKVGRPAKRK